MALYLCLKNKRETIAIAAIIHKNNPHPVTPHNIPATNDKVTGRRGTEAGIILGIA